MNLASNGAMPSRGSENGGRCPPTCQCLNSRSDEEIPFLQGTLHLQAIQDRSATGIWMTRFKLIPSLRPAASNPALQDVPPANLAAAHNWRGIRPLRTVATPTLTPTCPATYGLQLQRGTNHDVSFKLTPHLEPPLISACLTLYRDDELYFFIAHLQLLTEDAVPIQEPSMTSSQRLLYGSLVANPQEFFDQQGDRGYFFLFPDVSLRVRGRYRLGISLTRLQ